MKPAQWIALLVVVTLMVFGITFAVSSLPGRKSSGPKSAPVAKLTFADLETRFPAGEPGSPSQPPPAEYELGKDKVGTHDFWFKNENPQDLPVGVFSKTCQCTSVDLWVAPKDWTDVPEPARRDEAAKKLESAVKPTPLKENEGGAVVPAGAVGLVRLTWTGDRLGEKSLSATLWMGEKGPGPTQTFEISTAFVGPVRAPKEYDLPPLALEELPRTVHVHCWSSTRTEFPLEVRLLHSRWKDESNPFEVGKPEPLTEDELAQLRKNLQGVKVLSGYKVPITLGRRSRDDKTPMDLGPFWLHLELGTPGAEPVRRTIKGLIRGDLAPVDADAVRVDFGPFVCTKKDLYRLIQLQSGTDVTELELDKERTPNYLSVDETSLKASDKVGGRRIWNVQVNWVPDAGPIGKFPRDDDAYRDSAVYLRPVYADPRPQTPPCLRIEVGGEADPPH